MKSWFEKNVVETYSMNNEGKPAVAERFIRTLKDKIYEYMTLISRNVYVDKLDEIVNQCNNTYHKTIKMKPVDISLCMYIEFNIKNNKGDCKFKVVDNVRISKYKNIFAKDYVPNWSEEGTFYYRS